MTELSDNYAKLTKHPEGSLRELAHISLPLMLTFLSGNLMMFFDRMILADYDTAAMNAVTAASLFTALIQVGFTGVASISEVFVGQYNGSKEHKKIGPAVWQLIWFSLASFILFSVLAEYSGPFLLPKYHYSDYGLPYFRWMMYFSPVFALNAALAGFFIGRGKSRLVLVTTVLANILNVAFDFTFIFGALNIIPAMGPKGAALATGLSQVVQTTIYFTIFLSKESREKYATNSFKFIPSVIKKSLKIGVPSSAGHMIETAAWAVIIRIMAWKGETYLTISAIGQSLFILVGFAMSGLQQGVTTIASNLIGAKRWNTVEKTWKSGFKFLLIIASLFALPLLINPYPIIKEFLSGDMPPSEQLMLMKAVRFSASFVWVYFIVDGLTWTSAAILTAAGDTVFVMIMNGVAAWLFALIPFYYFIVVKDAPAQTFWPIACLYGSLNAFCFYLRYRSGKWKNRSISDS